MQAYHPPSISDFSDTESKPTINFVIVSEDLPRGVMAKHLYDDLVNQMGTELAFNYEVWPFRGLQEAALRALAAHDAGAADIVIFAVSGRHELPDEVKSWMDSWLRPGEKGGALVMLCDKAEANEELACSIQAYLGNAARKAGLEFLANTNQPALGEAPDESLIQNLGFREHMPLRLLNRIPFQASPQQWGFGK